MYCDSMPCAADGPNQGLHSFKSQMFGQSCEGARCKAWVSVLSQLIIQVVGDGLSLWGAAVRVVGRVRRSCLSGPLRSTPTEQPCRLLHTQRVQVPKCDGIRPQNP